MPTTTAYTENNAGYFDPPDFRPNMVYFPARQGVPVESHALQDWPHGFRAADGKWILDFDQWLVGIFE